MKKTWMAPVALAVLVVVVGCEPPGRDSVAVDPPVHFDTATVVIQTGSGEVRLTVEVAATHDQRAYGLMERPSLPHDSGMLFTYPELQDARSGFWMYRTLIPLDIAFLDEDGVIVAIEHMDPCESTNPRLCPIYSPGVPYQAALEVNGGALAQWGVSVGDRVRVVDAPPGAGE